MRFILRYAMLMVMLALPLAVASCGSSSSDGGLYGPSGGGSTTTTSGTTAAGGANVMMKNIQYDPQEITVKAGTTVTWTNEDSVDHTVTSDDGLFDSGHVSEGETFSYTFDKPGTYNYHCTLHPPNMKGTVVVE